MGDSLLIEEVVNLNNRRIYSSYNNCYQIANNSRSFQATISCETTILRRDLWGVKTENKVAEIIGNMLFPKLSN